MSNIKLENLNDAEIIKELGGKLRQIRLSKNISQSEISELSGVDRITISKIENGRPASISTWIQLLRAVDKLDIFSGLESAPETETIAQPMANRRRASTKREQKQSPGKPNISFEID